MARMHSLTVLTAATRYNTMIPLAETGARGWRIVIPEMDPKKNIPIFLSLLQSEGWHWVPRPLQGEWHHHTQQSKSK